MPAVCCRPTIHLCNERVGYKFPKNKLLIEQWLAAVRRDKWKTSTSVYTIIFAVSRNTAPRASTAPGAPQSALWLKRAKYGFDVKRHRIGNPTLVSWTSMGRRDSVFMNDIVHVINLHYIRGSRDAPVSRPSISKTSDTTPAKRWRRSCVTVGCFPSTYSFWTKEKRV